MNKQQRINTAMRLLSVSYRPMKNAIRISKANTLQHELAKFFKCWELLQDGKEFYTEAVFGNGGRADIFVPVDYSVFEILHSETEKEALSKIKKYPPQLDIYLRKSFEVIKEHLQQLKNLEESEEEEQ